MCIFFFFFNEFQSFFYIKYICFMNGSEAVYFLCVLTLLLRHHTDNWKRFKWSSFIPCVNLRFCWLILSHMCVPLWFLNFPVHGTIYLHLVHVMFLPCVFKSEYLNKLTFRSCVTCFWYLLFYERVHNIGFSVIWNIIIFRFCNDKLLKYPFMLDVVDQLEIR